jgi:integrase
VAKKRLPGEGTIFLDRKTRLWNGRIPNPDNPRKPFVKRSRDQKVVKAWFDETKSSLQQGLPPETGTSQTLADYLLRWLELSAPGWQPRTLHGYQQIVDNHLIPQLGRYTLKRLRPEDVQAFLNELGASGGGKGGGNRSGRTVIHVQSCLSGALAQAKKWGLVARNVASPEYITLPDVDDAEIHPFTSEQAVQLLSAALGERHAQLLAVLLNTGIRPQEAQGLRWQNVFLDAEPKPYIQIIETVWNRPGHTWQRGRTKSRASRRRVPLVAAAREALLAQKDRQAFEKRTNKDAYVNNDFVFALPFGEPFTSSTLDHDFKKILKKAGLDASHRPYDLRHTCATYLLAAGVSEKEIMDILGHTNLRMSRHYMHVLETMRDGAMDRLETWMGANQLGVAGGA